MPVEKWSIAVTAPSLLKHSARRLGLYRQGRLLWRCLSPEVRAERARDRILYGSFLGRGDLVFDIGANLGQKTEVFLDLGARVVALEPNPDAFSVLSRDLSGRAGLTLVEAAAGAEPGRAVLNFCHTSSTASLRTDWDALRWGDGPLRRTEVPVTTLDTLIEHHGLPQFCKIDVEGFETEVLRGLSQRLPCLSLEYHRVEPNKLEDCLAQLEALGPIEVNAIAMNGEMLLLDDWLAPQNFLEWAQREASPRVADAFVRNIRSDLAR
jgi:FkbM family methyltransferase